MDRPFCTISAHAGNIYLSASACMHVQTYPSHHISNAYVEQRRTLHSARSLLASASSHMRCHSWQMPKLAVHLLPTGDAVHPLSLQFGQESAGRAWLLAAQLQPVQPDPGAGPRAGDLHHERLPEGLLTSQVYCSGVHELKLLVASLDDRFRA